MLILGNQPCLGGCFISWEGFRREKCIKMRKRLKKRFAAVNLFSCCVNSVTLVSSSNVLISKRVATLELLNKRNAKFYAGCIDLTNLIAIACEFFQHLHLAAKFT
jgi:hypothetical protein